MARVGSKTLVSFRHQQNGKSKPPTSPSVSGTEQKTATSSQEHSRRRSIGGNISSWFNQRLRSSTSRTLGSEIENGGADKTKENGHANLVESSTLNTEIALAERGSEQASRVKVQGAGAPVSIVDDTPTEITGPPGSQENRGEKAHMDSMVAYSNLPTLPKTAVKCINVFDTTQTTLGGMEAFNATYLQPLKMFNAVVTSIAGVHPYAKMAFGVLTWASQMIITQVNCDAAINGLVEKIGDFYKFITEDGRLSKLTSMRDILKSIADQIFDCARFIQNYSETKCFWVRLSKNVMSETSATIGKYNDVLDMLIQSLRERLHRDAHLAVHDIHATVHETHAVMHETQTTVHETHTAVHETRATVHKTHIVMHQILKDLQRLGDAVELNSMTYASGAGLNTAKKCLEGTRIEVLDEIVEWIYHRDPDTPRVFWLSGQAGTGKSAIAHTIALWTEELGGLGSCFCFARDRQAEHRHEKLFLTIARDLAGRNPMLRQALAGIVAEDPSLKSTIDIERQWCKLILEPVSTLVGDVSGNTVVVIDGLDESGDEKTREGILAVLASTELARLPNLRILLTSRPLLDIHAALDNVEHINYKSLDDVDDKATRRDIHLYIKNRLQMLRTSFSDVEVSQLVTMSDGLFEWARLACEFIKPRQAGINAKKRFNELISRTRGQGSALLDNMYRGILCEIVNDSQDALAQFQSVMRQLLYAAEPLSVGSLNAMRRHFSSDEEPTDVEEILEFMAALLSGTSDQATPVRPLHASFYEFLSDRTRGGDFYVDKADMEFNLALASLRVMQQGLKFNICELGSSYLRNSEVPQLEKRVKASIPPHLSYACRFWANHLQKTRFNTSLGEEMTAFCGSEHILFWIEALSLLKSLGTAITSFGAVEKWSQGQGGFEHLGAFAIDGAKFIQTFGAAISTSTPHLYLSALPFSPAKSLMSTHFIHKFANLPQVASGQQQDWSMQQVLRGHVEPVASVAFSPDGKLIVSGSWDKTICIWDAHAGTKIGGSLKGHTLSVLAVAFSPDGKWIVSGSEDKRICIWETHSGSQIHCIEGHSSNVKAVAFSPDGKWIVSGSNDETVCIWDAHTGSQKHCIQGHTAAVNSVAFSPDGKYIVSGSLDTTVCLWDAHTGSQIHVMQGHDNYVYSVAFSPDGKQIVSASRDSTICLWDVHSGSQKGKPFKGHIYGVCSVAFSPDGMWIVSGAMDDTICLWNTHSGSQVCQVKGHKSTVLSVSFSPDSRWITSGSGDNTVCLWDAHAILHVDTPSNGDIDIISAALSPDGKCIVSGSEDGLVHLWDANSGLKIGGPFEGHTDAVGAVGFSSDGKWIVSGSEDTNICIWDVNSDSQIHLIQGHTKGVCTVAFSVNAKWVASGSDDATICLWDAQDGTQRHILSGHTGRVNSVTFSPDGKWVISGSDDKTICLWDVDSGSQVGSPFKGHTAEVWSVAFSPDGRHIVSGSKDCTVCLWDAHAGTQIGGPLRGHIQDVTAVSFSLDGKMIVSGSHDCTICLWDPYTGVQIGCSLQGHAGGVVLVAFSSDGSQLVSCSLDKTIRLWNIGNHDDNLKVLICFSSTADHALCNVEQLFERMKLDSKSQDYRDLIKLNHDGWVVGSGGQLLFWIPAFYHGKLYSPRNTLVIPRGGLELNLSKMVHGDMWKKCYFSK